VTSYPAQLTQKPLSTKFSQPTLAIPVYHRYKPTLEWKHPPQQQKNKQQENTNLHAPHAVCIHSCSVKRNKLRKGYFHDTNYGRKEPNQPQIINMELGTAVCISTKEKKERGFQ
jgi:hypothetical protein